MVKILKFYFMFKYQKMTFSNNNLGLSRCSLVLVLLVIVFSGKLLSFLLLFLWHFWSLLQKQYDLNALQRNLLHLYFVFVEMINLSVLTSQWFDQFKWNCLFIFKICFNSYYFSWLNSFMIKTVLNQTNN